MAYDAEDFRRGLVSIWDSTASDDEETSVTFFLLSIMQKEGAKGVVALIEGLDKSQLGEVEISQSGADRTIKLTRSGFGPLIIEAYDDDLSPSVDVRVESDAVSTPSENPRHAAFYSIWERLLESESSPVSSRSTEENAVYLMALLESEVMNGGLGQYLTNTEGRHLTETFSCLKKVGAIRTNEILAAAVELASAFDSYVEAWDEKSQSYSELDASFLECGEDLAALTAVAFLGFQE